MPTTLPWRILAAACLAALPFAACTTDPRSERVGSSSAALFTDGDFETGTAGQVPPAPWTLTTNLNSTGVTIQTPQTLAGLNLANGGKALTTTIAASNAAQVDLGNGASLRVCRYGAQCAQINFHSSNAFTNGKNVNALSQQMTVGQGDVDGNDNLVHVRFVVAPVLQNPGHPTNQQPYYFVQLTNDTTNSVLYTDFNLSAQPGVPWKCVNCGTNNEIDYVDWSLVDIAPGNAKLAVGDKVTLTLMASGCQPGGHYGELYADGIGVTVPGLYVSGTGPAQANAGTNITYTITYKNGGASAASGVVTNFTTPPNTTFQSYTAPAGATCTAPAQNTAGTVACTFASNIAAGASGSYTVTVNINNGTVGTIIAGTYDIASAQESPLIGPKIKTLVGCAADSDCTAGNWCNESANACTPTLANGVAMPTDNPHANPTLNGTCSVAAATLVCTSGACDTKDNACGLANGDGTCTQQNGAKVCRSGTCSQSGFCMAQGACLVDADCSQGNWCNISAQTCTPTLANGVAMPKDGLHSNPTLDGTCSAAAGSLVCTSAACDLTDNACGYLNGDGPCSAQNGAVVCRSAVCDPDLKCGYAVGDGPCSAQNQATVCRSGACSVNNKCEPNGGCNVDADCSANQWCDETQHTCGPKLANGTGIPTDAAHQNPTLNGKCSPSAALTVCVSSVCDMTDDKCGYLDGDGPCDAQNGGVVCRSTSCSQNLLCMPKNGCNVDADCSQGNWCNEAMHVCSPTLANGVAIPTDAPHQNPTLNGKCTQGAGALVCTATVCDTKDDACGFVNGDGPCSAQNGAVVCRSAVCDPDLKCGYANGDGPCDAQSASVVCRSGKCATSGPGAGKCAACTGDSDCSGATPACENKTSSCVQCTAGNASACKDTTPLCDTVSDTCVGCDGDFGNAGAKHACASDAPFCSSTGACGKCTKNADCAGHPAGNICDVTGGSCTTQCRTDSDCDKATQWCNAPSGGTGACVAKLPNGAPLPSSPSDVSTCTWAVAARVCKTAACDPATETCGAPEPTAPDGGVPSSSNAATLEGGGCSCRTSGQGEGGLGSFALAGVALTFVARRRRRRA